MRRKITLFLVLVSVFSLGAFGQTKVLKVAVGLTLPPYIIQDSGTGIEVDILKQALPGYDVQLQFVPFARVRTALDDGSSDAALTINEASGLKAAAYSDSHITYQNVVVTLASRNLKVTKVADLAKLRIAAFQDAKLYLGPEFAAMAKANSGYSEVPLQKTQVKFLFLDRADALVTDINIFQYFRKGIADTDVSAPVTVAEIFPPTAYKVAFKDPAVRDLFNAGLKKLRSSGKYDQILAQYLK